ncbi:MAG: hypothetical protein ABJA02_06580 [Acidobacteriota bacterium]
MTNKIRRREIRVETHKLTIIRGLSEAQSEYCTRCHEFTVGITLDQAAAFSLGAEIQDSFDRGDFHLLGPTLVCSNSLGGKTKIIN